MPYQDGEKVPYNHGANDRGIYAVNEFSKRKIHFEHNFDVCRVLNTSAKMVNEMLDQDAEWRGYRFISA